MAVNLPQAPLPNLNSKAACPFKLAVYTKAPSAGPDGFMSTFEVSNAWEVFSHLLQLVQGDYDTLEQLDGGEFIGDAVAQPTPAQGAVTGRLYYARNMAVEETDPNAEQPAPRELSVAALHITDHPVLWFCTDRDFEPIFTDLGTNYYIDNRVDNIRSTNALLFTLDWQPMATLFDHAIKPPHSDEYLEAQRFIHVDSMIPEAPDDALAILTSHEYLSKKPVLKTQAALDDDRYVDHLGDWEVYILERTNICAAQYLLVKRRYFDKLINLIAKYRQNHDGGSAYQGWDNHTPVDLMSSLYYRNNWSLRRTLAESWFKIGLLDEDKF